MNTATSDRTKGGAARSRISSVSDPFYDIVDEAAERLKAGETPDVETYAREFPQHAERLRQIWPSLAVLAALGNSVDGKDSVAPLTLGAGETDANRLGDGVLGDFRILREIGRGGMGVVYEAEQISLSRHVALKVLPFAGVLDPRQLQRFKNESRAAASLHHAHIVPVFAVGAERGVHYYAMQYIEGQTLEQIIRELAEGQRAESQRAEGQKSEARGRSDTSPTRERGNEGSPTPERGNEGSPTPERGNDGSPRERGSDGNPTRERGSDTNPRRKPGSSALSDALTEPVSPPIPPVRPPSLSTARLAAVTTSLSPQSKDRHREVARLGIQIAEALDHAHSVGITHRDIKPSNLIIDGNGNAWITDFGLAQMEADVSLTQTGELLGTLRYMSPEQAAGERGVLDHRTDIYSLGITLYELLALRPAFDGASRHELLRQVTDADPRTLRDIDRSAPRDLETIVQKAISKEPSNRYRSAGDLAADLRRFLNDEPILARRRTAVQKIVRLGRRHSSLVLVTTMALLVCTIALSISTLRTQSALDVSQAQTREANRQRRRAEKNLAHAQFAVDRMLTHVAENRLFNAPHMSKTRKAMLDEALRFRQTLAKELGNDPSLARDTAIAHMKLGDVRIALSDCLGAIEDYEHGAQLIESLTAQGKASEADRRSLAEGRFRLGHALWYAGRSDEAKTQYSRSLSSLQELIANAKQPADHLWYSAFVKRHLAYLSANGEEQEKVLSGARETLEKLVSEAPQTARFQQELGNVYFSTAHARCDCGKPLEQHKFYELAIAAQERAVRIQTGTSGVGFELMDKIAGDDETQMSLPRGALDAAWELTRTQLKRFMSGMPGARDHERSLALIVESAMALQKRISSRFPDVMYYSGELARNLGDYSWIQEYDGDLEGALQSRRHALSLIVSLAPTETSGTILHSILNVTNDRRVAVSTHDRDLLLGVVKRAVEQSPNDAVHWELYMLLHERFEKWNDAKAGCRQCLAMRKKRGDAEHSMRYFLDSYKHLLVDEPPAPE